MAAEADAVVHIGAQTAWPPRTLCGKDVPGSDEDHPTITEDTAGRPADCTLCGAIRRQQKARPLAFKPSFRPSHWATRRR